MSDLISREVVIDVLKQTGIIQDNDLGHLVIDEINRIPTAYDVEKVVENINNIDTRRNWNSSCEECINHTTCKEIYNEEAKTKSNHLCSQVIKKLAIKEVRKGGME